MKILYVSHKPIYPKIDGGCVAMANFLNLLLANKHKVKHLTIETNKHPFKLSNYPEEVALKTKPEAVKIDTDITITKAFLYLFKNGSYNVQRFYSVAMASKIKEVLKSSSFDIVILESLFSTPYLSEIKQNFQGNIFLRSHNVEFKIWEDIKNSTNNWFKKRYINKLFKDIKEYEVDVLSKVDGILTISNEDNECFKRLTSNPITTISLSLNVNENLENDYTASNFFHLGGIDWKPNKEAVERLIKLFTSIKKKLPKAELHIIGKGTEELEVNSDSSIVLEGFVDEFENHCISKGILVTPIVSGSGIRIKILEMMALGVPVITTSKGAQGIDQNYLTIANSDNEIITACIQLSSNKNLRIEMGLKAKSYISQYHSISNCSEKLNTFLGEK